MDLKYWVEVKRAKDLGIKVKTWHNMPSFMCPHCPYDSMDLDNLVEHIPTHNPQQAPRVTEKIVDKEGSKIIY